MDITDFTEQDEIEANIVYEHCPACGNQYAASILERCPTCPQVMAHCNECFTAGVMTVGRDGFAICPNCGEDAIKD